MTGIFVDGTNFDREFSATLCKCLKENSVLGILSAYKLFYVGCSRARRNLTILLDRSKLQGDVPWQKEKFKELGFSVEEIFV